MRVFNSILIFVALLLVSCESSTDCEPCINPFIDYENQVTCIYVTDGDTFKFEYEGETIIVRCLYYDSFESRRGSRLDEQAERAGISSDSAYALGQLAKEYAQELMLDNEVTIQRDTTEDNIDVYGRLLRVTIVDGQRLDSIMLAKGYALPYEE